MKRILCNCLFVLSASLVTIACAEFALQIFYPWLPLGAQSVIRDIARWGHGEAPLAAHWHTICVGDKQFMARNRSNLDNHRVQFGPAIYAVTTRSLGFDGFGFRSAPRAARTDVVVVGDSFSFCHHLDAEHCWVNQLAEMTGLEIANLAVPATGSVSHSRYLERLGRALKPRYVVWQYWVNDPFDDVDFLIHGLLPCPLENTRHNNDSSGSWRSWFATNSAFAKLAYKTWQQWGAEENTRAAKPLDALVFETKKGRRLFAWKSAKAHSNAHVARSGFTFTSSSIQRADQRTKASGGAFLLVIAPSNLQVYTGELSEERLIIQARAEHEMSDKLVAFAVEHDIQYLDLRTAFARAAQRDARLYPDYDAHWTRQGNLLTAQEVAAWLDNQRR